MSDVAVDPAVRELAERTPNFGYLLRYGPLLVTYGAMAEASLFPDPNTTMIKCRQFGEALAEQAFIEFGIPSGKKTFAQRVKMLSDQGFLTGRVRGWFDDVRLLGNRAVHEGYAGQRDALLLLRKAYDLGAWFHRTVGDSQDVPPFVPPQPLAQPEPTSAEDASALQELRELLGAQHAELTEMRLRLDEHTELASAQAAAQEAASQDILRAVQGQSAVADLIKDLSTKVDKLQQRLSDQAANVTPIDPGLRDEYVARSKSASRPLLNEVQVRRIIDRMLVLAGWQVQDVRETNVHAAQGVAVREVTTASGRADYLLYVDAKLVGVIEAKREGTSLGAVDRQTDRYAAGLDPSQQLAAWRTPLPIRYESTAVETRFTNDLDPVVRPRRVFAFHQPATIARWIREAESNVDVPTLRHRLRRMPLLIEEGLREAQVEAIQGLEQSLSEDKPRALIQMATGAGKTFTMVTETYRLLRHAGARRVLFLVDRNNLGRQAQGEFDNFKTPDDGTPFGELYNVQRLRSDVVLGSTHVVISTVQRLYSMLRGEELPDNEDEPDDYQIDDAVELEYNAAIPPETFDLVIVDECHRSIYGKWRSVLEYFDAHLVGLTATPVAQTFGFFHENLVSQYTYRQAVVDEVNVDYDIMRVKTEVGEQGGSIPADVPVRIVDLHTKRARYELLDTNLDYSADAIGRTVMNPSQVRKVIQQFHDDWPQYFPPRQHVPKTLIFAKTDQHADDIVEVVREIFGGDSTFCAKITYRAENPEQLISDFRNDAAFRIAVTVDMIATGTDVKPLECVIFLRGVSSPTYFEQMKGRGARTIDADEFQRVTPDGVKTKFLLVDPVGVTDSPLVDAKPLQPASQRQVSLEKLLNKAASQGINVEEAAALASRLAKLGQQITPGERAELAELADGTPLQQIAQGIERATDEETQDKAFQSGGKEAQRGLVLDAVRPLAEHPELRQRILNIRRKYDLPYDEHTIDRVISVEARRMDEDTSRHVVEDWRQYMADNTDEIAALRVAFSEPGRDPHELYKLAKRLAAKIEAPPYQWTPTKLWQAYKNLGIAKGNGRRKDIPDLVAILRFELGLDGELRPPLDKVEEKLANWIARQEQQGVTFNADQRWWLGSIAVAIANRLAVTADDLDTVPFTERGGCAGFIRDFGDDRAEPLLDELNRTLPA